MHTFSLKSTCFLISAFDYHLLSRIIPFYRITKENFMCGIAGGSGYLSSEVMHNMISTLTHRGPDHLQMQQVHENVHLAHTRLSIIDLSPSSHQPLWSYDQHACITFNGEIYNYKVLRDQLIELGYIFSSQGDAEVILNLYLEYGEACLQQLNGIFSFAIWDTRSEQLFVVRDPFGVKPLYYSETDDGFFFASEIKALMQVPSISKALNVNALFRTIVFLWSPGQETVLKHVHKLETGHYLIVKDHKIIQCQSYWQWPAYDPQPIDIQQSIQAIQSALRASVRDQLVADVPVGAFLSGGLDSSLIVALAKEAGINDLACFTIQPFSATQGDNDGFVDDLPYARQVAKVFNLPLHIIETHPNIVKWLSMMIYHLDEPQADVAPINVALICEQARKQGIKVLLSGAGGDDLFTGYRRHTAVYFEKYWSFFPRFLRCSLQKIARYLPNTHSVFRRITKAFAYAGESEHERLLSYFYWLDPAMARGLFTVETQQQLSANPMEFMLDDLKRRPENNKLEKMLYLERQYFLPDHNFNYTDKMSMAHGVEVRVPFLDHRVIAVVSRLHVKLKQKKHQGKWILKKMAEKYLPHAVIYRPKAGFGAPLRHWLKHDLKSLVDEVLSADSLTRRKLFNPEAVSDLINQDRQNKADYSYPIFALLCIELWCRIFIDEKSPQRNDVFLKQDEAVTQ